MAKPIGEVVVAGHGKVPIYNPGATPDQVPHVLLEEEITEHHLDANRKGILNRPGGFLRVEVKKQTRNQQVVFKVFEFGRQLYS